MRHSTWRARGLSFVAMLLLITPSIALAQDDDDEASEERTYRRVLEPWYATFDTGIQGPLNDPVDRLYNAGGSFGAALYGSIIPEVALGGRIEGGFLGEGEPIPQVPTGAGVFGYAMIGPSLRLRPFASLQRDTDRRATGFYVDLGPAGAFADGHVMPAYRVALGYNFAIGPVVVGPVSRFTHLIETGGRYGDNDILTWSAGLEVAFLDHVFEQRDVD